ncbi:MAG TPA: DnaB-like helicase C-terminal domain-containing protein, partial [Candidatus Absconditabacterales bacterium]|nr:DnaB-like helicase C-terminal domain-containing protein [Candidatus Absconditabacterales bacterium]
DRLTGKYTPNDPNEYTVILTDTVGNLVNTGGSTKQTIDTHSAYCRSTYRDLYNYIPINISHANRAISDPVRAKLGEVFPILSDIKETNMLEQDSSVVLTLFNPYKHMATFKDLQRFMGYDINILRNRFRCIGVLKNRHGADNIRVGLVYHGECGSFSDLPKASEMTADDYKNVGQYKSQSGNSSDTETEV